MIPITPQTGQGFSYPYIIQLAKESGLPYSPSSTYRPGDPKYHGRGWAVDFGGYSQDALAQFFMQYDTLEVIHHSDKTGRDYGTSQNRAWNPNDNRELLNEHRNHVHVAMTPNAAKSKVKNIGGAQVNIVGGLLPNPLDGINQIIDTLRTLFDAMVAIPRFFLNPKNILRIAMFILGVTLVGYGVVKLDDKGAAGNAVKAAAQTAKKVANTNVQ